MCQHLSTNISLHIMCVLCLFFLCYCLGYRLNVATIFVLQLKHNNLNKDKVNISQQATRHIFVIRYFNHIIKYSLPEETLGYSVST